MMNLARLHRSQLGHPAARIAGAVVAGVLAIAAWPGCRAEPPRCAICYMPIPPETLAEVRIGGGRPRLACDARCPLTYQAQTGQQVELTRVTDYQSGAALDPKDAVYVTGSDTAPDAHTRAVRTTPNDAAYLHWHRCLPSVLAFESRQAADEFQRSHGGDVVTLAELGFAGGR